MDAHEAFSVKERSYVLMDKVSGGTQPYETQLDVGWTPTPTKHIFFSEAELKRSVILRYGTAVGKVIADSPWMKFGSITNG